MKLALALAVPLLLAGGPARAADCPVSITEQEALGAEDARYAAQTTNDFAAMERLFGPELVYVHSSAVVDDKASYIEVMRSGTTKYRRMRRDEAKVRVFGCLAVITGVAHFDITSRGQESTVDLRFHSVWAKRAGGLQFVSWQATRLPPPQ